MGERTIEALHIDGKEIYVEVSEITQSAGETPAGDYENTSSTSKLIGVGDRVRATIGALASTLHSALSDANADQWTLEVNLGFKGKTGIPFVAEGEANGALKVTATWKK